MNDINNELILAARLLLATLFLFRLEKAEGLFGHRKSDGAAWRSNTGAGCCRSDVHGTSSGVCGRRWRVHISFRCTHCFYTLGTALIGHRYWTMTDKDRVDQHG